jgi:histidinol-phosphate phosphatase family protein
MTARFDIVIPSSGRRSLYPLLSSLEPRGRAGRHGVIVVVDRGGGDLEVPGHARVVAGRSSGPASARNVGWRTSEAEWIVFLDDDVVVRDDWFELLAEDLESAAPDTGGVQGRIRVSLPSHRRPTDWERNVAGLEGARWATADMAYRRRVLAEVGGFDERFPRAYREDSDLALRVMKAGHALVLGKRTVSHPVPPADPWVSLRKQAGVQDDLLMRRLHGRDWRVRSGAPPGRKRGHLLTVVCAVCVPAARAVGLRRTSRLGAACWFGLTGELALRRILPGPRSRREVMTMVLTSAAMPFVVAWHQVIGSMRARRLASLEPQAEKVVPESRKTPKAQDVAVLFDRDGTLVVDEPYNGDPGKVVPVPGARRAVDKLRRARIPTAVVSNQSGVGRGLLRRSELDAVNRRIEELLGPLGPWFVCPHAPDDGCACRKPSPELIVRASRALGVPPSRCVVIGDIGSDVEAALAAGARPILVPTAATLPEEVAAAPEVASDLEAAIALVLEDSRHG